MAYIGNAGCDLYMLYGDFNREQELNFAIRDYVKQDEEWKEREGQVRHAFEIATKNFENFISGGGSVKRREGMKFLDSDQILKWSKITDSFDVSSDVFSMDKYPLGTFPTDDDLPPAG